MTAPMQKVGCRIMTDFYTRPDPYTGPSAWTADPASIFDRLTDPVPPPYVDFDPADYIIRPCAQCTSWWAEVVHQDAGMQVVREWHDRDCPALAQWR